MAIDFSLLTAPGIGQGMFEQINQATQAELERRQRQAQANQQAALEQQRINETLRSNQVKEQTDLMRLADESRRTDIQQQQVDQTGAYNQGILANDSRRIDQADAKFNWDMTRDIRDFKYQAKKDDRSFKLLERAENRADTEFGWRAEDRQDAVAQKERLREAAKGGIAGIKQALMENGDVKTAMDIDKFQSEVASNYLDMDIKKAKLSEIEQNKKLDQLAIGWIPIQQQYLELSKTNPDKAADLLSKASDKLSEITGVDTGYSPEAVLIAMNNLSASRVPTYAKILSDPDVAKKMSGELESVLGKGNPVTQQLMAIGNDPAREKAQLDIDDKNRKFATSRADSFMDKSKKFIDLRDATNTVFSALDQDSSMGDHAAIFAYLKVLDGNSTIREGEFDQVQKSTSIPDKVKQVFKRVEKGRRLTPDMIADMRRVVTEKYKIAESSQAQLKEEFGKEAARYGFNPEDFTRNFERPAQQQTTNPREEEIRRRIKTGQISPEQAQAAGYGHLL